MAIFYKSHYYFFMCVCDHIVKFLIYFFGNPLMKLAIYFHDPSTKLAIYLCDLSSNFMILWILQFFSLLPTELIWPISRLFSKPFGEFRNFYLENLWWISRFPPPFPQDHLTNFTIYFLKQFNEFSYIFHKNNWQISCFFFLRNHFVYFMIFSYFAQ